MPLTRVLRADSADCLLCKAEGELGAPLDKKAVKGFAGRQQMPVCVSHEPVLLESLDRGQVYTPTTEHGDAVKGFISDKGATLPEPK